MAEELNKRPDKVAKLTDPDGLIYGFSPWFVARCNKKGTFDVVSWLEDTGQHHLAGLWLQNLEQSLGKSLWQKMFRGLQTAEAQAVCIELALAYENRQPAGYVKHVGGEQPDTQKIWYLECKCGWVTAEYWPLSRKDCEYCQGVQMGQIRRCR